MSPIEIVRAMLAAHEREHGIHPQGAPFPRRGDTAVHAAYHDALCDVIAALEQADSAPRLEWTVERRHVHRLTIATAKVDGFEATVRWSDDRSVFNAPACSVSCGPHVIYNKPFTGDAERGKRIAELAIHRHRRMLDEIARVK